MHAVQPVCSARDVVNNPAAYPHITEGMTVVATVVAAAAAQQESKADEEQRSQMHTDTHASWVHEMARIDTMKEIVTNLEEIKGVRQAIIKAKQTLQLFEPKMADNRQPKETVALQLVRGAAMLARRRLQWRQSSHTRRQQG